MLNVKVIDFISKLTKNRREQKYLKKIIHKIKDDNERKMIEKFLYLNTFNDIKDFLSQQNLIDYTITPEDFEKDLNFLKEKIAYELNEAILKKYS